MDLKSGYRYSPLEGSDSIRLLQVKTVGTTAQGRGPIRCWIRHFSLSNAPPYRALSYGWGPDSTKKIFLNDKIVTVRRNLWEALAHIQFACFDFRTAEKEEIFTEENSKWVWIDVLCVDMSNVEERNGQVPVMGAIYGRAVEVLVWLGCESDFRHGARISAAMEALALMNDDKSGQDPSQVLDRNHEGLLALFQLPYWQRLWIVQEVILAAKITLLFDKVSTSWKNITNFRKLLSSPYFPNKFGLLPGSTFTHTHKANLLACQAFRLDRHRTRSHRHVLGYLIEDFQDTICTDPRDKVYGLLGLADDCQQGQIEVNYFKTLFQLYADVIDFYSSSRRSPGPSQHTPRFSQILQQAFKTDLTPGATEYQLKLHPSLRQPTLHIFSVRCGFITKFIRSIDLSSPSSISPSWYKDTAPADPGTTLQISFEKFKALLPEQQKLVPLRTRTSFGVQAKYASPALIEGNLGGGSSSGDILGRDRQRTLQFLLDNGRMGYAPYNTLPGDMIVQFLGCDVAAVLRPTAPNARPPVYDIIGKALVEKGKREESDAEPWARKYNFAVPDYGQRFTWTPEEAMYLYLDVVTLQYLTQ